MATSLREYFPEFSIPDRPPDESTLRRIGSEAEHEIWYPQGNEPGIILTGSRPERLGGMAHLNTLLLHTLGELGMRPALEALGVQTAVIADKVTAHETAAMCHPNWNTFLERANRLFRALSPDTTPLQLVPYHNQEDSIFTSTYLFAHLAERQMPIATEPHQFRHDATHAIAALCVPDSVVDGFQSRAIEALEGWDRINQMIFADRFEYCVSTPTIAEILGKPLEEADGLYLAKQWQKLLRVRDAGALEVVFTDIRERVSGKVAQKAIDISLEEL